MQSLRPTEGLTEVAAVDSEDKTSYLIRYVVLTTGDDEKWLLMMRNAY